MTTTSELTCFVAELCGGIEGCTSNLHRGALQSSSMEHPRAQRRHHPLQMNSSHQDSVNGDTEKPPLRTRSEWPGGNRPKKRHRKDGGLQLTYGNLTRVVDGQLHFHQGQVKGWPKAMQAEDMDSSRMLTGCPLLVVQHYLG
ncbi:hypothetical protein Bbelb_282640 [Branchiostoma belcheri]|nr:hypothetical protein Bbelb_282640 [Branchiostoma belcheri]